MQMNLGKLWDTVNYRAAWHATVLLVAKSYLPITCTLSDLSPKSCGQSGLSSLPNQDPHLGPLWPVFQTLAGQAPSSRCSQLCLHAS